MPFGQKEAEDLEITEEELVEIIKNDEEFLNLINKLIKDNSYDKNEIDITYNQAVFDNTDLHFSLHKAIVNVKGAKNPNNTWNLDITVSDEYDFTEFKRIKEYFNSTSSIPKSLLSTTLNNLGVASTEYGVLKPYRVTIKFKLNDYNIKEEIE
jgi:hypothetical protein